MPAWLSRNVRVLSAVSFLQDAASELLYPLLPIYLTAVLGAPPAVVGAVEGAAEGAAAMTKLAAGPLGDRYAKRPLIATGYGMAALGKVMVAAASAWPGVLAGRVVDRLGKGIRGAPRDALLVADIDDGARGRVFGFHRAMDTLGASSAPCWAWPATSCWTIRSRHCCGWPWCRLCSALRWCSWPPKREGKSVAQSHEASANRCSPAYASCPVGTGA